MIHHFFQHARSCYWVLYSGHRSLKHNKNQFFFPKHDDKSSPSYVSGKDSAIKIYTGLYVNVEKNGFGTNSTAIMHMLFQFLLCLDLPDAFSPFFVWVIACTGTYLLPRPSYNHCHCHYPWVGNKYKILGWECYCYLMEYTEKREKKNIYQKKC